MGEKREDVLAAVGKYASLAMVLPSAAFTGYIIGYLLDKAFHTSFLGVVLLILGIIGGLIEVIRTLLKDTKDS
jgi:F0F1-type ATP synthase assembly protein I